MRVVPIHPSTVLQIPLNMLIWVRHNVTRIAHNPDRLHPHDHVLQNVTVNPVEHC